MTAFQRPQRGRYIGPVWIGISGIPSLREHRIIIEANGALQLTADQARRLGEEALALADELQTRSGPASPFREPMTITAPRRSGHLGAFSMNGSGGSNLLGPGWPQHNTSPRPGSHGGSLASTGYN